MAGLVSPVAVCSGSGHMPNTRAHSTRVWAHGCASWPLILQAGGAGLSKLSPCSLQSLHFWVEDLGVMAALARSSPRPLKKTFGASGRASRLPLQPVFYPDKTEIPSNITGQSPAQSPGSSPEEGFCSGVGAETPRAPGHTGSASSSEVGDFFLQCSISWTTLLFPKCGGKINSLSL